MNSLQDENICWQLFDSHQLIFFTLQPHLCVGLHYASICINLCTSSFFRFLSCQFVVCLFYLLNYHETLINVPPVRSKVLESIIKSVFQVTWQPPALPRPPTVIAHAPHPPRLSFITRAKRRSPARAVGDTCSIAWPSPLLSLYTRVCIVSAASIVVCI